MRKYLVNYLVERNDMSMDLEMQIKAKSLELALVEFKNQVRVFKRITAIEEI